MRLTHYPGKFEFYNAILTNCGSNTDVLNATPVLYHNFEFFKDQIGAIKEEIEAQKKILSNLALERCKSKEKLCNAAADIVMLSLWGAGAREIDRKIFYDTLYSREGKVFRRKLTEAYNVGIDNMEKLKDFGITKPLLDAFLGMIDFHFSDYAAKKREEVERAATRNFKNLYRTTEAILRAMDKEIKSLKEDYPYFFASYREIRKLSFQAPAA